MAHPRYPQAGYVYSGGYYPMALPTVAQYPQYPGYYYPYNVGYPAGPAPVSPRVAPRRPVSPHRPVVTLHPVLTSSRTRMTYWSVTDDAKLAKTNIHLNGPELIHPSILDEPATTPELRRMLLVSDDFPWTITLQVPQHQFITVGLVLDAIHGSLHAALNHDEWEGLSRNARTNAHRSRCVRLARMPARYAMPEEALVIKRVDWLADKTIFLGIKALGDPENPEEWNVRLGYVSERDRKGR